MQPTVEQWKLIARALASHAELATAKACNVLATSEHHAERRLYDADPFLTDARDAMTLAKAVSEHALELQCCYRTAETEPRTEPGEHGVTGTAQEPTKEVPNVSRRGGSRTRAAAPD